MSIKIDDDHFEKVSFTTNEAYIKTLSRIFMRELRLFYAGFHSAFADPITLLKRTFTSASVDRAVRPKTQSYEKHPKNPNGAGVLLCHGFAATPEVFSEMTPKLLEQGYVVRAIRLSGHGTTPGHLAQTSGVDWFATVVWHYKELRKKSDTIYFVGHSLGGTLGLLLATIYDIKSVVAMCAPIRLNIPPAKFVRQASLLVKYWPRSREKKRIIDEAGLSTYKITPLYAMAGVFEVGTVLRSRVGKLNCPVFYISAGKDNRTFHSQPDELRNAFPDTPTEFKLYENSPHSILIGPDKDDVVKTTVAWIDKVHKSA